MDSGVARKSRSRISTPIATALKARLNPDDRGPDQCLRQSEGKRPSGSIFAEAENEVMLRAAIQYRDFGYGEPVLVGQEHSRCSTNWPSWACPIPTAMKSTIRPMSPHGRRDGCLPLSSVCNAGVSWTAMSGAWSTRTAMCLPRCWSKLGHGRCDDFGHDPAHLRRTLTEVRQRARSQTRPSSRSAFT